MNRPERLPLLALILAGAAATGCGSAEESKESIDRADVGVSSARGLTGYYYDNSDFTNLKLTRIDPTVNFSWGSGAPSSTMGADTFSVRWTGAVVPLYSETYTFYTTSDDGVRLSVGGKQIINNYTNHSPTQNTGQLSLTAGQAYPLRLEYYENTGGATISLSWASASQPKEIVPQTQLFASTSTVSNSLTDGATISGTYNWTVTTAGDAAAVEYWATDAAGNHKLGTISGSTPFVFPFDTTTRANGTYLFGIVEVDSAGARYPDSNRVHATIQNGSTPPPPPPGTVVWRGDYETGNWNQWATPGYSGTDHLQVVQGGSATIQSSVVRQGTYAAKFTTPPYDGTNRSRCQIYRPADSTYGNEGQENWFAWSSMIGSGSVLESGGWNNLTSFHQKLNANTLPAPDHFTVTNSGGTWTLRLDSWGGDYDSSTGWNQYRETWNLMTISAGDWYDVVFHVKWSADPNVGFVEVWINGQHILPLTYAATLYSNDGIYLKQGYDGGGASGTTTVYNDGSVIAKDYAGAISAFPAGSWPPSPPK